MTYQIDIQWNQWDEASQHLIRQLNGNVYGCWVYVDHDLGKYHLKQPHEINGFADYRNWCGIVQADADADGSVNLLVQGHIAIDGKRVAPYLEELDIDGDDSE